MKHQEMLPLQAALTPVGGVFPMSGRYSLKAWAVFLGCSTETVRRHVHHYDIPFRQPGAEIFVEATDFWNAIPVQQKAKRRRATE